MRRIPALLRNLWRRCVARLGGDAGAVTVEYALLVLVALAVSVALYKVVSSDHVRNALMALFDRALT